jgi:hypothetical protein
LVTVAEISELDLRRTDNWTGQFDANGPQTRTIFLFHSHVAKPISNIYRKYRYGGVWLHSRARRASQMSLIGDRTVERDTATRTERGGKIGSKFGFVPDELAVKCRSLIESFHAMYGYVGLPDMLWLSDARDIIECHEDLAQAFKKASRSRGAKRANDSFLTIATAIVAIEMLARDFAGWGKRFPAAKRAAEKHVGDGSSARRTWLMDLYLYPPLGARQEFSAAPETAATGAEVASPNQGKT